MAEKEIEYSKKIDLKTIFKIFKRAILAIIIIMVFIIIAGSSIAIILKNDTSDSLASKEEREDIEKWVEKE